MAALRRHEEELLLLADDEGDVDEDEILAFYFILTEGSYPIPHRHYSRFILEKYSDEVFT